MLIFYLHKYNKQTRQTHNGLLPYFQMAKNALQKIEEHEKLCRIMQKQTFEQIKEVKERITRIERMIIGGGGAIVLALVMNMMK